jgi:Tfp pilus assembly protein FimT
MFRLKSERGASLMEVLVVVAMVATITGIAVPQMLTGLEQYRINSAGRQVAAQIRAARLAAVTANRVMLVRFNCPGPGMYRVVEFTGDPGIDDAADRCSAPWPDQDAATLPNVDGPPAYLQGAITFGATQDLRITTTGSVTPLTGGMPALIEVTNGSIVGQITVSAAGRVQMQ